MNTTKNLHVVGLCGSLRMNSYNRLALEAARELMPADMQLELLDLRGIPLFDADTLTEGMPDLAAEICEKIASADAVLFGSPEYNFSISGVLKNAIDWISRDASQPFYRKPIAILSATQGPLGGARSQYDLRKMMGYLDAHVLNKPEVFIGSAQNKFDTQGKLVDAATTNIIAAQMKAFGDFVRFVERGYAGS